MHSRLLIRIGQWAQRYPLCVAGFVLAVLLAGASAWLQVDLRGLEARLQVRAREGQKMLKLIARGSQLRTELAAVRTASRRIDENLVVEKNIPENFWYFYKVEQDTQVKLTELQQRPAAPPEPGAPATYKRVPFSLKLAGSFRSVITFLQWVETGPRFQRVNSFLLQRQDLKSDNVVLQLDLELLGRP
jgi:hypothetical protein